MARRKAPGALPTMLVSAESVSYDRTKFNMHIVKYWRPDGCTSLRVAFLTWHNETVNIYTHLLPIPFVAMLLLRDYGGAVTPLQSRASSRPPRRGGGHTARNDAATGCFVHHRRRFAGRVGGPRPG